MGLLYDTYVPDAKVFRCPTTPPGAQASLAAVGGNGTGSASFAANDLTSYGYDPRHLNTHQPAVALVSDKADPTSAVGTAVDVNSANHDSDGQNVLYADGHSEWEAGTDVGFNEGSGGDQIFTDDTAATSDNRHDSFIRGWE